MCLSHLNIRSTLSSPFSEFRADKTDGAGFISHVLHQQTDICLSYSQIVPTVHLASAAVRTSESAGHPSFRHINTDYSRIPRHCTLVIATITSEIYVMKHSRPYLYSELWERLLWLLTMWDLQLQQMWSTMQSYIGVSGSSKKNLCCITFATNLRNSHI